MTKNQEDFLIQLAEVLDDEDYIIQAATTYRLPMSFSDHQIDIIFKAKRSCTPEELLHAEKLKNNIIDLVESKELKKFDYHESSEQYNIAVPKNDIDFNAAYDITHIEFYCKVIPYKIFIKFILDMSPIC